MKHYLAAVLAATLMLTACNGASNAGNTDTDSIAADSAALAAPPADPMTAPSIQPNEDGLITLAMCPTKNDYLRVEVNADKTEVNIFQGNKLFQVIADEDPFTTDGGETTAVHFMDANFDGYTDIFIGEGAPRNYSTLFLWNQENKEFNRTGPLGEPMLQGFMLHVPTKSVIEGGSASAFAYLITRSTWSAEKLRPTEELVVVNGGEEFYEEYEVSAPYTLREPESGKVISSAQRASALPQFWSSVLQAYEIDADR